MLAGIVKGLVSIIQQNARGGEEAGIASEDQTRQLIEGVGDLRAHDDERRDHHKKAETHERLEPNAFFWLTRESARPGSDFNTHW
jgi:hypothetical protein